MPTLLELVPYLLLFIGLAGFAWLILQGNRLFSAKRLRSLLPLCSIALLLGGAFAPMSGTQVARAQDNGTSAGCTDGGTCATGTGLNGKDASLYHCWDNNAFIAKSAPLHDTIHGNQQIGTLRVWFSQACQTNWIQFIGGMNTVDKDQAACDSTSTPPCDNSARGSGAYGVALGSTACSYTIDPVKGLPGLLTDATITIRDSLYLPTDQQAMKFHAPLSSNPGQQECDATSPMVYAPESPWDGIHATITISATDNPKNPSWQMISTADQSGQTPVYPTVVDVPSTPTTSPTPTTPPAPTVTSPCGPGATSLSSGWSTAVIGSSNHPGVQCKNGTLTINDVDGSDIWNTSDGFTYAYYKWSGNGVIIAHVDQVANTIDDATKSGVMIRQNLLGDSPNALAKTSWLNHIEFQNRQQKGGSTVSTNSGITCQQCWLRLVRQNTLFYSYYSDNGSQWIPLGFTQISMGNGGDVSFGLAVTARESNGLNTTTFSSVSMSTDPGSWSDKPPKA